MRITMCEKFGTSGSGVTVGAGVEVGAGIIVVGSGNAVGDGTLRVASVVAGWQLEAINITKVAIKEYFVNFMLVSFVWIIEQMQIDRGFIFRNISPNG